MLEPPVRSRPLVGRRSMLRLMGVAALGLVASCRSGGQATAPATPAASATPPSRTPRPAATSTLPSTTSVSPTPTVSALSADELVAQRVAAAEQAMLAAYDAVALAHPELAGRLAAFRADHLAHLQGLVPAATPSTTPSTTPAVSPPASSAASAGPPLSSAPTSAEIFQSLANLERTAAAARLGDVATTTGSLARLIASIGGCEAAHAALLSVAT